MSTITKAWLVGTGSIVFTFNGVGNGTVTVESDPNNLSESRSQVVTISTLNNEASQQITITQAGRTPNFITRDGESIITSDNKEFYIVEI